MAHKAGLSRRAMAAAANVINRGLDECPDHHPGRVFLERMDQICRPHRRINVATRDFACYAKSPLYWPKKCLPNASPQRT